MGRNGIGEALCWSLEASAIVTGVGVAATGFSFARKDPPAIWATIAYFSLMEGLQTATYTVIDACGTPANQLLTILSFVHICFQPFFINLISMSFIPPSVRHRVAPSVYVLCAMSAFVMLAQLYPFNWLAPCEIGDVLCGDRLCAITGTWHIGWEIPYRMLGFLGGFPTYLIVGFALPLLYGSWRMTLFHFIAGPAAAYLSTNNPNEWPAVWCLYSVGLILIVVLTPLRRAMVVRSWIWPAGWIEAVA
jgi:hypothetical protein